VIRDDDYIIIIIIIITTTNNHSQMLERDKSNIDFQLTFIHKRVTKLTERFMFRLKNFGVEYSPKIIILRHFVEQTKAIEIDNILFIQTCVVINTRFETQRYSLGITDVDV
jgi:hypothetical protein